MHLSRLFLIFCFGSAVAGDCVESDKKHSHLSISWGNNPVIIDEIIEPLKSIFKNTPIRYLLLDKNNLGDDGVVKVLSILEGVSIEALSLSGNQVGEKGVQTIVEKLPQMPSIEVLDLSYNQLNHKALCLLADAIKKGAALRELDITGNWELNTSSGRYLAEAVFERHLEHIFILRADWSVSTPFNFHLYRLTTKQSL